MYMATFASLPIFTLIKQDNLCTSRIVILSLNHKNVQEEGYSMLFRFQSLDDYVQWNGKVTSFVI
jgi:hypothetical protein